MDKENYNDLIPTEDVMIKAKKLSEDPSYDNAVKLFGEENVIEGFAPCKICGKTIPTSKFKIVSTPLLRNIVMEVCDDCFKLIESNKLIKYFCYRCKTFIAAKEPLGTSDKSTGFIMTPGGSYHITHCPKCDYQFFQDNPAVELRTIEEMAYVGKKLKDTTTH